MKTFLKLFRILFGVLIAWPIFLIAILASVLHELLDFCHLPKAADAVFRPLCLLVCWWMMLALGSLVHVEGRENIPSPDEAVVFTPNHNSIADIPFFFLGLNRFCAMMAKKEVFKVPVVHGLLVALECVAIKRTSAHGIVEAVLKGTDHLKSGKSLVVFPEGTRSKTGEIGTFKSGAFKMAERAGCRVVPVVLKNDRFVWENGTFGFVPIYIKFLPPVSLEGLDEEGLKVLPQKVEAMVKEEYAKLPSYPTKK